MRNKEKKLPSSSSVSELILSAVYFLQKKNGVTAKDITKFICHKRGLKQSQMKNKVKEALERGTKNGIFNLKRGLYKVDETCKRKLTNLKKKVKKKYENKIQKKLTQKKVSVDKSAVEEKRLTPIDEDPDKSMMFKPRVGSHTLSEDIFDRRGRENSYFEPSVLARPSDEEFDDFDDDDNDNEDDDDEYSDLDNIDNFDIFTVSFTDEASHEKFPDFNVFSAAKQTRPKRASTRRKTRNKSSSRRTGKKRKISKPRKKKIPPEDEKKKSDEVESDDDDFLDEDDSDFTEESEADNPREKTKLASHPEGRKSKEKQKVGTEQAKKNVESTCTEGAKCEGAKESKENKATVKKKGKQTTMIGNKKVKKNKCESSEEDMMDREESPPNTKERSLSKSECMITSSTKLLPSDFKLSISPNMIVSDVKFSPTTIKFETQDSSTVLLADPTKTELADHEELFSDFKVFCECQPPKRKNSTNRDDRSSTRDAEPTEKRIKSN